MTTKKTDKKPNEQETGGKSEGLAMQGDLARDKIRAGLLSDPGSNAELLTRENTRDTLRDHYETEAARFIPGHGITDPTERKRVLDAWQAAKNNHADRVKKWLKSGGPAPVDMLNEALLTVKAYPVNVGSLGLHYPQFRESRKVHKALETLGRFIDDENPDADTKKILESFKKQVANGENPAADTKKILESFEIQKPESFEILKQVANGENPDADGRNVRRAVDTLKRSLREAGLILARAATAANLDPAAIESGLLALRTTYEPNPDGFGTASGVSFPDVNAPDWPACMDWGQVPKHLDGDLRRLADALVRLNHSTGKPVADKAEKNTKRTRANRRNAKKAGRKMKDENLTQEAVSGVLERLKNNSSTLSMKRACELECKQKGLPINWQALQKHVNKARPTKKTN